MEKSSFCSTKDSTWISAPITEYDKQTVTISYGGCASQYVTAIRYAWRESPCPFKKCAVYSVENSLPAPPFIQLIDNNFMDSFNFGENIIIPKHL